MGKFVIAFVLAVLALPKTIALADENPTCGGSIDATEARFISSIQSDITKRFPHAADAIAAGYVRYTAEDDTGAISYANRQWTSDPTHPSQLWYDKHGALLGADFSVPRPNGEPRPALWGIKPCRWAEFEGHVHWVATDESTGIVRYDGLWNQKWVAAGGSISQPSSDTVVKLGEAKSAADVSVVFEFPTIWDLIVWVEANPNGAFADHNPNVRP
jgi:hypothetical protein